MKTAKNTDKAKSPGFYTPMDIAPGEYKICPDCEGERIVSSGRPNIRDGHICFTCNGTGTVVATKKREER